MKTIEIRLIDYKCLSCHTITRVGIRGGIIPVAIVCPQCRRAMQRVDETETSAERKVA